MSAIETGKPNESKEALLRCHMRGWVDGAGGLVSDPSRAAFVMTPELERAYRDGHALGVEAELGASARYAARIALARGVEKGAEYTVYFFGCWNGSVGHYMHTPGGGTVYEKTATPWGFSVDSSLAPRGPNSTRDRREEIEGHAALHYKEGWTALAWWDRSVDTRGACNAGLYAKGRFDEADMLELGRRYFPKIMSRFGYTITTDITRTMRR